MIKTTNRLASLRSLSHQLTIDLCLLCLNLMTQINQKRNWLSLSQGFQIEYQDWDFSRKTLWKQQTHLSRRSWDITRKIGTGICLILRKEWFRKLNCFRIWIRLWWLTFISEILGNLGLLKRLLNCWWKMQFFLETQEKRVCLLLWILVGIWT